MCILVIGLGSMGKRRIRNLLKNNIEEVYGFDIRQDRRNEAERKYGIATFSTFEEAISDKEYEALVISVPPDKHMYYMQYACQNQIPCFVEASVVDDGMEELINQMNSEYIYPSCTLRFHPSIKIIKQLLTENRLGKVSNFSFHSGQYLPDWHPWENIDDFYVSNPSTGGCREIVPFELTWMNWVFGDIEEIKGFYDKTIGLSAPIDDVYAAVIRYKNGVIGTLVVDVVSRHAIRKLIINGELGQIQWDWDDKCVKYYDALKMCWTTYDEPVGKAEKGYNENLIEEMYVEEISCFLSAINKEGDFPNHLKDDYGILKILKQLEKTDCK